MNYGNILIGFGGLAVLGIGGLVIFIILMKEHSKKASDYFSNTPTFIREKYSIWYKSFITWTIVYYSINILSLITSIVVIMFVINIQLSNNDHYMVIIFSMVSILLLLISHFLRPKVFSINFYRAYTSIELYMLKYQEKIIDKKELVDKYYEAELISAPEENKMLFYASHTVHFDSTSQNQKQKKTT